METFERLAGVNGNVSGVSELSRYQPLTNFVLIKRIGEELDIKRGIIIPEIGRVQSNKGKVIAVGEGRVIGDKIVPIPLEPGDIVLFAKYGAEDVTLDGEEFLLLRYDEIKLKERAIIG